MKHEKTEDILRLFRNRLLKQEYSKAITSSYVRLTKKFLISSNLDVSNLNDRIELREKIEFYIFQISISYNKIMTQAALHAFYYFTTGEKFKKRLDTILTLNASIESELQCFKHYLIDYKKLSDSTIISLLSTVKLFLSMTFSEKNYAWDKLTLEHIINYLSNTISHVLPTSRKTIICRIKVFLKFLEYKYECNLQFMLNFTMTSPVWKLSSVPKHLNEVEVEMLLSSYDKTKINGFRDYAIARCFVDLGLRCCEVSNISLDDLNWHAGTVTINDTKTKSKRVLPLKNITGKAIEAYLINERPKTKERVLFVKIKRQLGEPMGVSQVRDTVRRAAIRAKLKNFKGTHMLRHTAAKEMINKGVNIKTIADVLGHKSIETTYIYLKLDFNELKGLARIWPLGDTNE